MIKKLLRIAATFGLLVAGYVGYVQGFVLVSRFAFEPPRIPVLPYDPTPSPSSREAQHLALQAFGPGHWTCNASIRYYDTTRGYWIYTQDYKRQDDGKKIELCPFALIWRSRHGVSLKTISSKSATLVFNKPVDMMRGGGAGTRVLRAKVEGDVHIRDDKGTSADLGDDLTIALDYLDFDEPTEQITSESRVDIRERDALATAEGLVIPLLPIDPAQRSGAVIGYVGAKSITLKRDVRVTIGDVGRTGIVPGGAVQVETTGKPREPRPGEITCAGELLIELPPPVSPDEDQPPLPPAPTLVHFSRDVIVRQGNAQAPEQLNCDRLHLTLLPASKLQQEPRDSDEAEPDGSPMVVAKARLDPPRPETLTDQVADAPSSRPEGGPVSNLELKVAVATGHAVWLQSKEHHVVGFGNELVYRRQAPEGPDVTYFRGDRWTEIRKHNSAAGTIDVIRSVDVTLYHSGRANSPTSAVARGPGWMETRRLSDQVVTRTAHWTDQLILQPIEADPRRRQLTLVGSPDIQDAHGGVLNASDKIVATLYERPDVASEDRQQASEIEQDDRVARREDSLGGGSFRIEMMQAWGLVTLVSTKPSATGDGTPTIGRTITARQWLAVVFEDNPANKSPSDRGNVRPTSRARADNAEGAESLAGRVNDSDTKRESPDPLLTVTADRIRAWVVPVDETQVTQRISGSPLGREESRAEIQTAESPLAENSKWDIREVRLRGQVVVHQDPPLDKKQGLDVHGEEVDLTAQGEKRYRMQANGGLGQFASATNDTMRIEGPVIGLDQTANQAWVLGPGKLVQENAGGGMLGDAFLAPTKYENVPDDRADPRAPTKPDKGPLCIAWGRDELGAPLLSKTSDGQPLETWMKFFGKPTDDRGNPRPAEAHFYRGVRASTRDAILRCEGMIAYLDAPVDFANVSKPKGNRAADNNNPGARAQVSRVVCRKDVNIKKWEFDDEGLLISRREIVGDLATYDRLTNQFHIDSPGRVDLYERDSSLASGEPPRGSRPGRPNLPMARPGDGSVRPAAVQTANETRAKIVRSGAVVRDRAADRDKAAPPPELKLTRIWFEEEMIGQLDSMMPGSTRQTGQADFFGRPRVLHAVVPDEWTEVNEDAMPPNSIYTVSDTLRVISEPPPFGSPKDAPDRILVQAWGELFALSRRDGRANAIRASHHMTFDSETWLSYIYGDVSIVDQNGGQPASHARGNTLKYNHKTGQHSMLDTRSIQLVDPTAIKFVNTPPKKPQKPKNKPFPRIPGSDKERRNFTGK